MCKRVQLRLCEIGDTQNREIFSIYAQIQFGTNARGDYKYQFAQNIQHDIQLRNAHNASRESCVLNL